MTVSPQPNTADAPHWRQPVTIYVAGEQDLLTAPLLQARLRRVIDGQPAEEITIDLSEVTFMDCAGLRPLLEAKALIGGRLRLLQVPPPVVRLFELTNTHARLLG